MKDFRELLETGYGGYRGFRVLQHLNVGEYKLSIQASDGHYCEPRKLLNNIYDYTHMEVAIIKGDFVHIGFDNFFDNWEYKEKFLENFDGCVAGYIPIDIIQSLYEYMAKNHQEKNKLKTKKLICILGKSASGKDTIFREILKTNKNVKCAISHTTRPMRSNETQGKEYHFISDMLFNDMFVNEEFIEQRKYKVADGSIWKYGLAYKSIDTEGTYIVIVDYKGYCELKRALGKEIVQGIYIIADMKERINRSLNREELSRDEQYLEIFRRFTKDEEDFPIDEISRECVILKNNDENDFKFCINYINNLINKQNIEDLI
ncbi:hypothetical protein [Clostridium perfringens]|uniref:hypothetical protein n=1 Tax=Clostridium perfringens TaxID=1502 RepID=UPI00096A2C96|nr:hypothetical protein [Clostridium perfringens]